MNKPLYRILLPENQEWRESHTMKVPMTDLGEQLGAAQLGIRLWRLPPNSAQTWHRHPLQEEMYLVLKGTGRIRINDETLTVPEGAWLLVKPEALRQPFNDTEQEVTWLIMGAPKNELESLPEGVTPMEAYYPEGPMQLPPELEGHTWPPTGA